MQCQSPEMMVSGTVESGKTHPMLQRLYQLHCQIPNLVTFICRKKKVDMRRSVLDQFELEILPFPVYDPRSPCEPHGGKNPQFYLWKNGGITYCFGMQEARSLLGARFDAGFVCQAEQLELGDWEFLSHRCGRAGNWLDINGNPYGQIWGDCNPDAAGHWIPKRHEEEKLTLFEAKFKDNIMFFRDDEWTPHGLARVQHLRETITGPRKERLIDGRWTSTEGAIFPEFDAKFHVIDELPPGIENWPVYMGIDYGHSDPTVCVWIAHNTLTDEMICFKEWRMSNARVEEHIEAIFKHSEGLNVTLRISDHDSQMNHQLQDAGIGTKNANKEPGSVLRGLDLIRARLHRGTLKFFKRMLVKEDPLIKQRNEPRDGIVEFGLYKHKPKSKHVGDSKKDDLPDTGQSDHFIDAVRYVIDRIDTRKSLEVKGRIVSLDFNNWKKKR